jgi:hypothetical protein
MNKARLTVTLYHFPLSQLLLLFEHAAERERVAASE